MNRTQATAHNQVKGIRRRIAPTLRALAWGWMLTIFSLDTLAVQVCATQSIGNEEFRGISGSSDSNVIAVGKKGTAYQFDGVIWNAMATPSNQDLNDVEVVGGATAFAVGRKGTALELIGGVWFDHTGFTNDDLFGVWAASPDEVYAVGEKGAIYSYDGMAWTDENAAAGANTKRMTDAWGDANSFYALEDKGILYRYDRTAGMWDAPDALCEAGGGFDDIWGNATGELYLVRNKDVYLHDGASCNVVATSGENLEGIYGWTADGQVFAVGKKGTVLHFDGVSWTETTEANEELRDDWVSPGGNAYYAGKKAEITTCVCIDCALPQFTINHDSYGINCLAETIQVNVVDTITGTPKIDYNAQVILDTQTGFGTWALVAGSGAFVDAAANDGLATYQWPLGESSAVFSLGYAEGPAVFDIDVYQATDPGLRDGDSEGPIQFSPNGFTLTAAPLGNPPPAVIAPFANPQIAGTDFGIFIAAYGQTPTDPVCGVIESYTGPKTLKFWSSYLDPGFGTIPVTVDGAGIATFEGAAAGQPVAFVNGLAAITGKYKDVGRMQILVKDDTVADPDLPNGIRGATAGFVVKPHHFELSNITDGLGNPNPGAVDSTGPVFIAAGAPFSATVTALDAEGDITPNYGQEALPESVRLTAALVDPVAGSNPPVSGPIGFGPFVGGQATGADFAWREVGIITLVPSVRDLTYFDAGDVAGLASANVGRFYTRSFRGRAEQPGLRDRLYPGRLYLSRRNLQLFGGAGHHRDCPGRGRRRHPELHRRFLQDRQWQPCQPAVLRGGRRPGYLRPAATGRRPGHRGPGRRRRDAHLQWGHRIKVQSAGA